MHLSTEVVGVERTTDGFRAEVRSEKGRYEVEADLVVHAAGRIPDIAALDLDAAEVAVADGRLRLNAQLQSVSNPRIYAAGDAAAAGPPLTPVSSQDGKVAADNMLAKGPRTPDYQGVPSVVFTVPPLAAVGMSEEAARAQGGEIEVRSRFTPDWFTARRLAEPIYGHKTIVEAGTGKILGAHLVGPNAEEVINIFALAIRNGLKAGQLKDTIFAYPTGASDIGYMLS